MKDKISLPTPSDRVMQNAFLEDLIQNMDNHVKYAYTIAKMKKISYDAYIKEGFSPEQAIILCKDQIMKLELASKKEDTQLLIKDLKEGDIAVITDRKYTGTIIKIFKNYNNSDFDEHLQVLSLNALYTWDHKDNPLKVRRLEKGELLEIF